MSGAQTIDRILAGDPRAVARAISKVEDGTDDAAVLMKAVFPHTGRGLVVGITGSPGAGKSSSTTALSVTTPTARKKRWDPAFRASRTASSPMASPPRMTSCSIS